jgi:hypothetical protein
VTCAVSQSHLIKILLRLYQSATIEQLKEKIREKKDNLVRNTIKVTLIKELIFCGNFGVKLKFTATLFSYFKIHISASIGSKVTRGTWA